MSPDLCLSIYVSRIMSPDLCLPIHVSRSVSPDLCLPNLSLPDALPNPALDTFQKVTHFFHEAFTDWALLGQMQPLIHFWYFLWECLPIYVSRFMSPELRLPIYVPRSMFLVYVSEL